MELGLSALEREVDRHIESIFKDKTDLQRFFKTYERKPEFLKNLAREMRKADAKKVLKSGPETIAWTVREMTKTYCRLALQHQEERQLSALERSRRIQQADQLKESEGIVREAIPDIDLDNFKVKEAQNGNA